jgi:DNA-binding response OmpR family regulator
MVLLISLILFTCMSTGQSPSKSMASKHRVLIIDNDESICEFISMALVDMNYDVALAHSTQTALDLVDSFSPDLIILEMWLPIHSGQVFLEKYHQLSSPHAPVIALSTSPKHEATARENGATTFLIKPFDLNDLLSYVEDCLTS